MALQLHQQYRALYKTYSDIYGPHTCIFFLVGKFYELFDTRDTPQTSVKKAVDLLGIALKEKETTNEVLVEAGFPEQSLHKFANLLTREGWTVVVVDQVKDPKTDSVLDRVPVRILTPGTHVEMATQDRMCVASLWIHSQISCSLIDLTTGEVVSFEGASDQILHMLQVYSVKEVIAHLPGAPDLSDSSIRSQFAIHGSLYRPPLSLTQKLDSLNAFQREEYIRSLFQVKSLLPLHSALQLKGIPVERSLVALLRYLEDHFPKTLHRLVSHSMYQPSGWMRLSTNILEQLNMITYSGQKSVLHLLDRTCTAIGKRALRERILRPLTNAEELQTRWSTIAWMKESPPIFRSKLESTLKSLYDLPRIHYRLSEGLLTTTDVLQLSQSYSAIAILFKHLENTPLAASPTVQQTFEEVRYQCKTLIDEQKAVQREESGFVGYLTPIGGQESCKKEQQIQSHVDTWTTVWKTLCKKIHLAPDSFHLVNEEIHGNGKVQDFTNNL